MPAAAGEARHYWAQCVAECRRRAVLALCQCTPHTKPVANRSADDVICSLEHMACLDKYREKLASFYPGDDADESLSEERADSVECLHCLPNCALRRYAARVWTVPYGGLGKRPFHNKFVDGLSLVNGTVLRIYFSREDQALYQVEANLIFYEVVAFLGNLSLLVMGITAITFYELVYFCTIRWRHHYKRRCRRDNKLSKLNTL
ncbi:pickpocket protein 11-like [Bicyclus anynana]|uniref:Pickpocket protein 11-like n=1 Tax=Bicyclus anynana TaxID=110368 RepID=A0A6J1N6Q3_BICAN|nr:pickpocket protein 11-like [Bicyclus anynana]